MPKPSVFLSYSHRDEDWKDRLASHLAVLEEQGLLATWDDRNIRAGAHWREEIRAALERANVAVVLVSAHSLTSRFILDTEISRLLERRSAEGVHILPVIVRTSAWEEVPWLAVMQVRPRGGKPLARFRGDDRDRELLKVAREVLELVGTTAATRSPGGDSPPPSLPLPQPLHQLPRPVDDFTGRDAELEELRAAVQERGVTISVVRGLGGVGKTQLALRLAAELKPHYPDVQLFLDLQGAGPRPLTPEQAMAHVIHAFYPAIQLPDSGAELAALYRSVLDGKRVLLLMDNAASREQVEPLIPPAGGALLVTSRFHFTLPGIFTNDLDELPQEDAESLLRRVTPRIGDAAAAIARLCGRLPLALRLAGSVLADKEWLTPAEYARRLADAKQQLGLIEASLALSYDLLREELQALWRKLAVFPGTFDAAGTAAVWQMELEPARDALGELINASLVDYENERYRLHDLARVFADARLTDAERETAQRRHADHYARVLCAADDLYLQGGPSVLTGLALFDAEWGNVKAGQAWAVSRFEVDAEAAALCSDYPDAGPYILSLRQHPRERIAWLDSALTAARHRRDRSAEAFHLGKLGVAYKDLGELRRAIEHYEQQLAIAREIGDRHGEGIALGNLGNAYTYLGEPRRAIEHHEQWLAIARESGDRRAEGNALNDLGLCYAALGQPRRAIEHYEQWLDIALEIGDRRGEGIALNNLGLAFADLGEPRRAIENYEQGLAIAREIGDRRGEGNALTNLGLAYADLGEPRRAIEYYEQQLVITREIGDRRGESNALGNLGLAYADLGEPQRAIEHYDQQLAIVREIGDRRGEAHASWNSGLIYEQEGDLALAADLMQVCVDYERSIGHPDAEKDAARVAALRGGIAGGSPPPGE